MGEPAIGGAKRWKILAPRPRIGVKIRKLYDRHLTRGGRASPRAGDGSIIVDIVYAGSGLSWASRTPDREDAIPPGVGIRQPPWQPPDRSRSPELSLLKDENTPLALRTPSRRERILRTEENIFGYRKLTMAWRR
jgi:hypothetical protein